MSLTSDEYRRQDESPGTGVYEDLKQQNLAMNRREADAGAPRMGSLPIAIYVDVNQKCNLSCPQCYRNHPWNEGREWPVMDLAMFELVARELFPTAYRVMLYGAGEPLLHEDIERMLAICLKYEVFTTMVSNGTLIDRESAALIAKKGIYIGFSVDGATRKTYEALRYPAKWEHLNRSLELIKQVRENVANPDFFPHIQVVVQRMNLPELPMFIDMAHYFGFELVKFSKLDAHFPELEVRIPDPEETSRSLVKVFEKANEHRIRVEVPDYGKSSVSERIAELREGNVFPISIDSSSSGQYVQGGFVKYPDFLSRRCDIPFSESMITPAGKVVIGCCSSIEMGDLHESTFASVWNGEAYQRMRETVNSKGPLEICMEGHCFFRS